MRAGYNAHARANRRSIALRSNQLDLDPVLRIAPVIAEQRRNVIHVQNKRVNVAVIVVVTERRAAARKALGDARSHLRGNVLELYLAQIPVNEARIRKGLPDIVPSYFRVNVPVHLHDVGPAVVVVIEKGTAPRDILVIDADS